MRTWARWNKLGVCLNEPVSTHIDLSFALLTVFAEAAFSVPRHWLGAQVDLLPALMVYAALQADMFTVSLLAVLGGMWLDSLSANPLGVSILPLLAVGFPIVLRRGLILRDLPFAQLVLGAAASATVPALTLLMLLNGGRQPLVGWGTLWQWLVMTAGAPWPRRRCSRCLPGSAAPWATNRTLRWVSARTGKSAMAEF